MATPEQNALLGMQLFAPAAEQWAAQNNARTSTLLKLMLTDREEQLRRDLANQAYDKSLELARMTGDREDARAKAANERQKENLTAAETREKERVEANEKKAIRSEISRAYPIYADEAANLGLRVRPRSDFDDSIEGLGDLQAEMSRLKRERVTRDQTSAADNAVAELDDAADRLKKATARRIALMNPTPEDEKFARARALEAVQQAIESGDITGAPKPGSAAAKKGLAALQSGDLKEAQQLLGSGALTRFETVQEAAMQAAPNFKGRIAQLQVAARDEDAERRNLATISSDLRRAAGVNYPLSSKLAERRNTLRELMTEPTVEPKKKRSLEDIFGPPPGAGAGAPAKKPVSVVAPDLGAGDIGGAANLFTPLRMEADPTEPIVAPSDDGRVPWNFTEEVRNSLGWAPYDRTSYAYDLAKFNRLLPLQNEKGRAITMSQLTQLLQQIQNDPRMAPAPGN